MPAYYTAQQIANRTGILKNDVNQRLVDAGFCYRKDGEMRGIYLTEKGKQFCKTQQKVTPRGVPYTLYTWSERVLRHLAIYYPPSRDEFNDLKKELEELKLVMKHVRYKLKI